MDGLHARLGAGSRSPGPIGPTGPRRGRRNNRRAANPARGRHAVKRFTFHSPFIVSSVLPLNQSRLHRRLAPLKPGVQDFQIPFGVDLK